MVALDVLFYYTDHKREAHSYSKSMVVGLVALFECSVEFP